MEYCVQYFCYCQGYWLFRKKYGDICQFIRDTCLFTSRKIVPSPYKQASTMHGYFVSATHLTVIGWLLIHYLMFLPFVCLFFVFGSCFVMCNSVSSLVLQSSGRERWNWLLYLVVIRCLSFVLWLFLALLWVGLHCEIVVKIVYSAQCASLITQS